MGNEEDLPPNDRLLTKAEGKEVIDRLIDKVFGPEGELMRKLIIQSASNPQLLAATAPILGFEGPVSEQDRQFFLDYMQKGDKEAVREMLYSSAEQQPTNMTEKQAEEVLAKIDIGYLRKTLLALANRFKGPPGPSPKLRANYYEELDRSATSLAPLIGKILTEIDSKTTKTPRELLMFWREDHRDAASFLLVHCAQFEAILNDKDLLSRAKRINTRARLVGDAIAGARYGLSPRTSIERVREARRTQKREN